MSRQKLAESAFFMAAEHGLENTAAKPRTKLSDVHRVDLIRTALQKTDELEFRVEESSMNLFDGVQNIFSEEKLTKNNYANYFLFFFLRYKTPFMNSDVLKAFWA